MKILLISAIIIILTIILVKFKIKHTQNIGNLTMITGGVKAGKSTLSVHLSYRRHKKNHWIWKYIAKPWAKLRKKEIPEEPLLYSNVPLNYKYYTPLKKEYFEKKERFFYKSVIYIQECSLLADSMTFKDADLNDCTLTFFKLIGHETKGGYMVLDTQCIDDVHYNIKRSLSTNLYVHKTFKWCPFLLFLKVQERVYDATKQTININDNGDVDNMNYKWLIFRKKKSWKLFDRYCYSVLTDHLPATGNKQMPKSLKANEIITFKKGKLK